MNVALTDIGSTGDGRTDLNSAFGVFELVGELTGPVRARSGSDLLFGYLGIKQGWRCRRKQITGLKMDAVYSERGVD